MNYWPWGDLSSKRQVGCVFFHMGNVMGLDPQLPSLILANSSRLRSLHVGRPGHGCHLSSPVGGWDPGRGADLQRKVGSGAAAALAKRVLKATLPVSGPYGRRAEGKRASPGPMLAPRLTARRPGRRLWAQSPLARPWAGKPTRDGVSPLPRCPEPRPAPTLTSSSSSSPSQRSPPAVPPPPTFRTGSSTENVSASTGESKPR